VIKRNVNIDYYYECVKNSPDHYLFKKDGKWWYNASIRSFEIDEIILVVYSTYSQIFTKKSNQSRKELFGAFEIISKNKKRNVCLPIGFDSYWERKITRLIKKQELYLLTIL
jgi:hypothetical protein